MNEFFDPDVYLMIYKLCAGFWLLQNRPEAMKEWIEDLPVECLLVSVKDPANPEAAPRDKVHIIMNNKKLNYKEYDFVMKLLWQLSPEKRNLWLNSAIKLTVQKPTILISID